MQFMVDPKQTNLFDPYEHVLSEAARRMVDEGWEGVFRHVVLELMPVGQVAGHFHDSQGRPTKELYSMAGLIFIMQFNDWTVERAAKAYRLDKRPIGSIIRCSTPSILSPLCRA